MDSDKNMAHSYLKDLFFFYLIKNKHMILHMLEIETTC